MIEEEPGGLTFSDADFERRYSPERVTEPANPSGSAAPSTKPNTAPIGRSHNRFMRTLLRRRLAGGRI